MWFFIGSVLVLLVLIRSEYEKRSLVTEEITMISPKLQTKKTFVFLSDFHNDKFSNKRKKLLETIDMVRPDFILIGGDFIISDKKGDVQLDQALSFIQILADRYKVYCGNGNHENRLLWKKELYGDLYQQFTTRLENLGVTYLSDDSIMLGNDLRITGINLPPQAYQKLFWKKKYEIQDSDFWHPANSLRADCFEILMAHSPLYFDAYRSWGADLSLTGHFHGGTIRLPGLGGIMTPQFQFFCPYCGGAFQSDGKWMIVSRGLGTHSINIRFNNKPQLIVVHLEP